MKVSRESDVYLRLRTARNVFSKWKHGLSHLPPTVSLHSTAILSKDLLAEDYVFVGRQCEIAPNTSIGRYSMLASGACIIGGDHIHDAVGQPMQFSGRPRLGSTHIARDVWIGRNALVMAGTRIGEGAIVAAGAVVTKDVRPYTIVAGVPATFVRNRFADEEFETDHSRVINGPLLSPSFAGSRVPEDVDG